MPPRSPIRRNPFGGIAAALALAVVLVPSPAGAVLHAGDLTPDFHKTDVDGVPHSLFQYRGQVVVMFLMGYN